MADRSLRSQLPVPYRWFGGYCRAWAVLTRWSWVPLGKQAFFIAVWLNRLFGGPREIFLRIHHAEIGLTLGDPRMLKVVHEALPGSDETAILAAVLSAGDSFIDVGANHGSYSVAACRIVGRTGFVVAGPPGSTRRKPRSRSPRPWRRGPQHGRAPKSSTLVNLSERSSCWRSRSC